MGYESRGSGASVYGGAGRTVGNIRPNMETGRTGRQPVETNRVHRYGSSGRNNDTFLTKSSPFFK